MMDLNKSRDFFNPNNVKHTCHVIGCGSIGGNVAELLVRYGITDIHLWDMDVVESHNLANQIFTEDDIGRKKTEALYDRLVSINPEAKHKMRTHEEYTSQILSGYVFMCVDSVEVRQQIIKCNFFNQQIKAVFDFRTSLLEGQSYMADWNARREKISLQQSLEFTHEEAKANSPVSACGFELSVSPVVRMISELGIANFTNLINNEETKKLIIVRPYSFELEAY